MRSRRSRFILAIAASVAAAALPTTAVGATDDSTPPHFSGDPHASAVVGQQVPWTLTSRPRGNARFAMHWRAEDPESGICENRVYLDWFQYEDPLTSLPEVPDYQGTEPRFVVGVQPLVGGSITGLDVVGGHAVALSCAGDWISEWVSLLPRLISEEGLGFSPSGDQYRWATVTQKGSWQQASTADAIDGDELVTTEDGAAVTYTRGLTGRDRASLIAHVGPGHGSVEVYVNGRLRKVLDTARARDRARVVIGTVGLPAADSVEVTVLARTETEGPGSARSVVALDGFVVI